MNFAEFLNETSLTEQLLHDNFVVAKLHLLILDQKGNRKYNEVVKNAFNKTAWGLSYTVV